MCCYFVRSSLAGRRCYASECSRTSVHAERGYLHASTNVPGSDDLNGINVKYRYEFTDALGLITSFSYANAEDEQKTRYSDTRWHEDSVRNRWFSVMAGPSVRVNEWFSAYAMARGLQPPCRLLRIFMKGDHSITSIEIG
ncbi:Ail/Lom family outer membrane beta-barrel protein [Escherichia coli]|uniref:Ail/Lom family outer membrane beta-barrel protein n=1 Tax=Escherichia coli TaxID=562 RepID=UPI003AFA3AB7